MPPPSEQEKAAVFDLPAGKFKDNFYAMHDKVLATITNKTINGMACDGSVLVDFLDACVRAINRDNNIDIPSTMHIVMENSCKRLVKQLVAKYEKDLPASSVSITSKRFHE